MESAVHRRLVFRADSSAAMGTGHVMRCLAIAQAWRDAGCRASFLAAAKLDSLETRLRSEGCEVAGLDAEPGSAEEARQTADWAESNGVSWVVLDGYHFDAEYQRLLKQADVKVLCIDDYGHAQHYYADIVLNPNIYATQDFYGQREPYTRLLLGSRYAPLRREFSSRRAWKRAIPERARKVLVTLGGADPDNVTLKVVHALCRAAISELEVKVILGGNSPHYRSVSSALASLPRSVCVQDATDMAGLMAWADIAVAGAGTTCWELAFMGLPSLLLILASNQRAVAKSLHEAGVAECLGWGNAVEEGEIAHAVSELACAATKRADMAEDGRKLIDGEGARRVLRRLSEPHIALRRVAEEDCNLLWEWANEPAVRAYSFSSEPIPFAQHVEWFRAKLLDSRCLFYMATNGGSEPIGQIRYDLSERDAQISLSVAPGARGRGYGAKMLSRSAQEIFDQTDVATLHAYVKRDNEASIRAFEQADFRKAGVETIFGHAAIHFILTREAKK